MNICLLIIHFKNKFSTASGYTSIRDSRRWQYPLYLHVVREFQIVFNNLRWKSSILITWAIFENLWKVLYWSLAIFGEHRASLGQFRNNSDDRRHVLEICRTNFANLWNLHWTSFCCAELPYSWTMFPEKLHFSSILVIFSGSQNKDKVDCNSIVRQYFKRLSSCESTCKPIRDSRTIPNINFLSISE